jgi:hypothetical protein
MATSGLIPFGEFAQRPIPQWIIRNVLPRAGLGVRLQGLLRRRKPRETPSRASGGHGRLCGRQRRLLPGRAAE